MRQAAFLRGAVGGGARAPDLQRARPGRRARHAARLRAARPRRRPLPRAPQARRARAGHYTTYLVIRSAPSIG